MVNVKCNFVCSIRGLQIFLAILIMNLPNGVHDSGG